MPQTLSAASRLRSAVLSVPNTVLLCSVGHPDQIIRFNVLPENLNAFKKPEGYIFLNLDNGPMQEAWEEAKRNAYLNARRDRPIPQPISVAKDSHEEWSVAIEDVPVVEVPIIEVVKPVTEAPKPPADYVKPSGVGEPEAGAVKEGQNVKCEYCEREFKSFHGYLVHRGSKHSNVFK